jgi:hypothetical protein
MAQLPGIPPIVIDAQRIVARHQRHLGVHIGTGMFFAMLFIGGAIATDIGVLFALGLVSFFAGLGIAAMRQTVTPEQLRDAQAVLKQWETNRDAWAQQAIQESMGQAAGEVAAYNEVAPRLKAMQADKAL